MRPTLLLLLTVGLVSCIPREGLGVRFAKDLSAEGGGNGVSSLALRSSIPDAHQGKERTKRCFSFACLKKKSKTKKEPETWTYNPIYEPKEPETWTYNPIYEPKTGAQSRPKRGVFGKSKKSRKERNKDADDDDDDGNDDAVDDYKDDEDEDEDEDDESLRRRRKSRSRRKKPKGKGPRSRRKRFKRGEFLERALRNLIVLSSHLNLNVMQNKTTPSADTMIKEVDEDQPAGKTDSRRSLGPVGGNEAQEEEVMDRGQKDKAEENSQEINAMAQENDDDDDDDDDDKETVM